MSLQEEELVSSHAGQPEQASSLLDQIMAQTRIQPGSEGYDVARQGVTAFIASILQSTASAEPVNKLAVDSMIAAARWMSSSMRLPFSRSNRSGAH